MVIFNSYFDITRGSVSRPQIQVGPTHWCHQFFRSAASAKDERLCQNLGKGRDQPPKKRGMKHEKLAGKAIIIESYRVIYIYIHTYIYIYNLLLQGFFFLGV